MALIDTRRSQMFPVLSLAQIETAKRFASGATTLRTRAFNTARNARAHPDLRRQVDPGAGDADLRLQHQALGGEPLGHGRLE